MQFQALEVVHDEGHGGRIEENEREGRRGAGIGRHTSAVDQVSVNSKMGLTTNQSLKTWGRIGWKPVLVLVDCGAYNNFIYQKLVRELNLSFEDTPKYAVEVTTSER